MVGMSQVKRSSIAAIPFRDYLGSFFHSLASGGNATRVRQRVVPRHLGHPRARPVRSRGLVIRLPPHRPWLPGSWRKVGSHPAGGLEHRHCPAVNVLGGTIYWLGPAGAGTLVPTEGLG
jgi:hypothetical protein